MLVKLSENLREVSPTQRQKQSEPILVSIFGSVIEVRPLQRLNTFDPIHVKLSENLREVSPLQLSKPSELMLVRLFGRVRDLSPLQP